MALFWRIVFIGESEELIKILPHIKRFDVEIVGMAKDEKRRFSGTLAVCLMKMRNLKTENFANFTRREFR